MKLNITGRKQKKKKIFFFSLSFSFRFPFQKNQSSPIFNIFNFCFLFFFISLFFSNCNKNAKKIYIPITILYFIKTYNSFISKC